MAAGTFIPHASFSLHTGNDACGHPTAPFTRPGDDARALYGGGVTRFGGRERANGDGNENGDGGERPKAEQGRERGRKRGQ